MTDLVIGPPPESRWKKIMVQLKPHPIIVSAIIAGIFTIMGLLIGSRLEAPKLKKTIKELEGKIDEKENIVRQKDTEIQRLETLLTPFRTIALEKFTGPEGEALKKLAERIATIDLALTQAKTEIDSVKTASSFPRLRKIANIRPDGKEINIVAGSRFGSKVSTSAQSMIRSRLIEALKLIKAHDHEKATIILKSITSELPEWPYAYFYLGSISDDRSYFKKCIECCQNLRNNGIIEPEPLLFEAMSQTFLGDFDQSRQSLSDLERMVDQMSLIPIISYSTNTPPDIVNKLNEISKSNMKNQKLEKVD